MLGEKDLLFLGCTFARIAGLYLNVTQQSDPTIRSKAFSKLSGNELSSGNVTLVKKNEFLEDLKDLYQFIYYGKETNSD